MLSVFTLTPYRARLLCDKDYFENGKKVTVMYKTHIVKILKNLSKTELRELGKFVQSPYFNSRPEVVQLYDALSQSLDGVPSVYQKEKLFALIAPKSRAYDDAQMRQWIHQLLKVIKAYFVQKEIEENKTDGQLLLAKAFRKRGMDDFFEKEIENTMLTNAEQPFRHADFHFKNYLIELEKIEYMTMTKRKEIPYSGSTSSLTDFFITEILRLSSVTLSYQTTSQKTSTSPLLKAVLTFLTESDYLSEKNNTTEGSVLKMYYHMFQAIETGNEFNFGELKNLLNEHWKEVPETECRTIYLLALNFCTKKINSAHGEYLAHFFDLTESGLKNRSLFENGIISKFTYKNAATAALKLEKYAWAKQFLDEYKCFLHPKEREAVYSYNLATYYFRMKDYFNAQALFQRADFGDVLTNLASKAMLIRIYTEINAEDALESLIDSFQTYIHRQKEIGYYKDLYSNFIRIVKRIKYFNTADKVQLKQLREEVIGIKHVAEKDWLLEKIAEKLA
jgi:hypothetical protein